MERFLLPLIKYLQCKPQFRVFWKTKFWKYYLAKLFLQEIILCPIHMAWSLGKVFGSRRRSIRVGEFIWFLEHLQTTDKHSIKVKTKHSKVFVKPHFIMIVSLSVVAWKSGCDRPTPLQESRPWDSQTRRRKGYINLDLG